MVYQIIRLWATLFLRLYFRKTIVYGLEHIPKKGPLIVASNHPSAFLEASIMGTILGRPLHYLVRGDMFHPKFQWLFDWTNQIPIYRQKDGISNLRKNASSFELTYRKLADGEAVLIFPEAKTILEKRMRPIQRIWLSVHYLLSRRGRNCLFSRWRSTLLSRDCQGLMLWSSLALHF